MSVPRVPCFHHDVVVLCNELSKKPYLTEDITPQLNIGSNSATEHPLATSKHILLDKLRPYQLDAVKWMIAREKGEIQVYIFIRASFSEYFNDIHFVLYTVR